MLCLGSVVLYFWMFNGQLSLQSQQIMSGRTLKNIDHTLFWGFWTHSCLLGYANVSCVIVGCYYYYVTKIFRHGVFRRWMKRMNSVWTTHNYPVCSILQNQTWWVENLCLKKGIICFFLSNGCLKLQLVVPISQSNIYFTFTFTLHLFYSCICFTFTGIFGFLRSFKHITTTSNWIYCPKYFGIFLVLNCSLNISNILVIDHFFVLQNLTFRVLC